MLLLSLLYLCENQDTKNPIHSLNFNIESISSNQVIQDKKEYNYRPGNRQPPKSSEVAYMQHIQWSNS